VRWDFDLVSQTGTGKVILSVSIVFGIFHGGLFKLSLRGLKICILALATYILRLPFVKCEIN